MVRPEKYIQRSGRKIKLVKRNHIRTVFLNRRALASIIPGRERFFLEFVILGF